MYVAIYLLEQPCFVDTFSKRHITVNFPNLSVDLEWFLPRISSGCSVLPNGKLMSQTATRSLLGPAHFLGAPSGEVRVAKHQALLFVK